MTPREPGRGQAKPQQAKERRRNDRAGIKRVNKKIIIDGVFRTDEIMALIKAACWPKGEQELPRNPFMHTLHINPTFPCKACAVEEYIEMLDKRGWKACKEWGNGKTTDDPSTTE